MSIIVFEYSRSSFEAADAPDLSLIMFTNLETTRAMPAAREPRCGVAKNTIPAFVRIRSSGFFFID